MFKLFLCSLLVFPAALSNAAVHTDGFYKVITDSHSNFNFIIELGSFYNTPDYLLNPVCKEGTFQALNINVNQPAFFTGRRGIRVVDIGNRHYRFIANFLFTEPHYLQQIQAGTLNWIYSEVDFHWATASSFTQHEAVFFYSSVVAGTTNCLALVTYPIQQVKT